MSAETEQELRAELNRVALERDSYRGKLGVAEDLLRQAAKERQTKPDRYERRARAILRWGWHVASAEGRVNRDGLVKALAAYLRRNQLSEEGAPKK